MSIVHLFNQNNQLQAPNGSTEKDEHMSSEQDANHQSQSNNLQKSAISTEYQSNTSKSPQSHAPISDFLSSKSNSANRPLEENHTYQMFERWHRANNILPQIDVKDIVEENPNFNCNKKTCPDHQHHPEYTQSSYLRLRCLEEAF